MRRYFLLIAVVLLVTPLLQAQVYWPGEKDKWELSFFGGVGLSSDQTATTPVQGLEQTRVGGIHYANGYLLGVRISETLGTRTGAELDYTFSNRPVTFSNLSPDVPNLSLDHGVHTFLYSLLYYPNARSGKFRPFISAGVGASLFALDGDDRDVAAVDGVYLKNRWKFVTGIGGGFKYLMSDKWGFRVSVRDNISGVPDYGLPAIAATAGTPALDTDGTQHNWQITGGVSFYWSGRSN